jgi:hypothetical protein
MSESLPRSKHIPQSYKNRSVACVGSSYHGTQEKLANLNHTHFINEEFT